MHPSIVKLAVPLSGNTLIQSAIEKIVFSQFLHYLIGIGAGSSAIASGETILFKMVEQHFKPGRSLCIFDVGANHGVFVKMAQDNLANTSLKIHAFEPGSHAYKILSESTRSYNNVILNNLALGDRQGESPLYYDREGSWLASLSKHNFDHVGIDFKYSEMIKLETLDNYCTNNNIQHIDLLKLDVEGHELDVLQGAVRMLESKKIGILSFEFGSCNIGSRTYFKDIFYFLKAHQMDNIFRITPSGYLRRIESYQEICEQFRTTNFVALPNRS